MKKPYLKKHSSVSKFTVWIVDGEYVRDNINEEFTNFGQHYRFPFIPKYEFWIDKEYSGDETRFYIDHLLVENRLMAGGKKFCLALDLADRIEKRERSKSRLIIKKLKRNIHSPEIINRIHKKLLTSYSSEVKVWIVDGALVRDLFFIDFTEGGPYRVYHFIPPGEIWIDDDLSSKERKFIVLHELHELNRMAKGWGYSSAHRSASELEYICRHHPTRLKKMIKLEMENVK